MGGLLKVVKNSREFHISIGDEIFNEKWKTEDKAQGGASDSSADTQVKKIEFSEIPKKPERSEEDSSDSDGAEHEATQEQPRPLR